MMKLSLVFLTITLLGCAATTENTSTSEPRAHNPYANFNLAPVRSNAEMQRPGPLPECGASMRQSKDAAFKAYQANPTPETRRNYENALKAYVDYMRLHRQYLDNTDLTPWDLQ